MKHLSVLAALVFVLGSINASPAQEPSRPYRLNSVNLNQPVIWDAQCLQPAGTGLSFGGQDQNSEDGRPHTRLLIEGQWRSLQKELEAANPLQSLHEQIWKLREQAKNVRGRGRYLFFQGLSVDEASDRLRELAPALEQLKTALAALIKELPKPAGEYEKQQFEFARKHLEIAQAELPSLANGVTAETLEKLRSAQLHLELAAEACAAEPPPRAMNCGTARLSSEQSGPESNTLVYDAKSKLYLLFGGDHLDYLTNDTWVFDLEIRRWFQRHPTGAPPPRANHQLKTGGDGIVLLSGGYTYSSNTDYLGGQYVDLDDGDWSYDIAKNEWSGGKLVSPELRVYRTGPFDPAYFQQGPQPNAAQFAAWLEKLPANEWVAANPPHLPRLNRDWGTARIDPDRDLILRWSGGHSAHGGTDVLHYHFATNRWELPFPVEFPLGQLYSNTSYPNGYNFNRRPWMTGHTYQNYDYDLPAKKMIKAGRPRHYYIYDPDLGDWIGRGEKPAAMQYNSCFYTLTLTSTPQGIVCWDKNGLVHRYDHKSSGWHKLELTGEELPGAYVDSSTIAYDANRDRVLMINALGYGKPYDGQVWSLDLKTLAVKGLSPTNREQAVRFANVDKCCFDPVNDLLIMGTYLRDAGEHTATPAYDCRNNRWVALDLKYATGARLGNTTRAFAHTRSDGLMHDPKRNLIWGTDTNSQVYVLRLDLKREEMQELK